MSKVEFQTFSNCFKVIGGKIAPKLRVVIEIAKLLMA